MVKAGGNRHSNDISRITIFAPKSLVGVGGKIQKHRHNFRAKNVRFKEAELPTENMTRLDNFRTYKSGRKGRMEPCRKYRKHSLAD